MNDENIIKWLKEHNENAFKEHNILEITDPKEVIMIEKEEYYNLKEENQRLNNDIKILLKENEAKEKVIIKYDNVLNELEEGLQEAYKELQPNELINGRIFIENVLKDLKESDK